jgi:hypothetical protein
VTALPEVFLDRFFRGPATTANGGYAAGVSALLLGEPARVRLHKPPPLGRRLVARRVDASVEVLDGDEVLLTAEPRDGLDVRLPTIDLTAARATSASTAALDRHPTPSCVVCGPGRADGFRLFPGSLRPGLVATAWVVPAIGCEAGEPVSAPIVWAALDCPGGWSLEGCGTDFFPALISQSVEIIRPVRAGAEVVVLGWETGRDERRLTACAAILGLDGEPLAVCRQTCLAMPVTWAGTHRGP